MSATTAASPVDRLKEIAERANLAFEELVTFLDSPTGRRLRRMLATGLIVSVPLVARIPGLRRSPLGRAIELVGGTTLIVRLAEVIRDWERDNPMNAHRDAVDVPHAR